MVAGLGGDKLYSTYSPEYPRFMLVMKSYSGSGLRQEEGMGIWIPADLPFKQAYGTNFWSGSAHLRSYALFCCYLVLLVRCVLQRKLCVAEVLSERHSTNADQLGISEIYDSRSLFNRPQGEGRYGVQLGRGPDHEGGHGA